MSTTPLSRWRERARVRVVYIYDFPPHCRLAASRPPLFMQSGAGLHPPPEGRGKKFIFQVKISRRQGDVHEVRAIGTRCQHRGEKSKGAALALSSRIRALIVAGFFFLTCPRHLVN
jgi:hypothetical protein